jgi:hypothetical protein
MANNYIDLPEDVTTINGLAGALTLVGGSGISVTSAGSTITITNTAGGVGSFTTGSVIFAGTTGALAQDNAKFFWDNTNFRLGIGTATPVTSLEVFTVGTGFVNPGAFRSNPGPGASGANSNGIILDNLFGAGNFQNEISLASQGNIKYQIGNDAFGLGIQQFTIFDSVGGNAIFDVNSLYNVAFGGDLAATNIGIDLTSGFGLAPVISTAGVAYGTRVRPNMKAAANNDNLTALLVTPTFNSNAHTGVTNNGLVVASGNNGFGTLTPNAVVHIAGASGSTIRIVDGNQGASKVLTSDANGQGSWQAIGTGGTVTSVALTAPAFLTVAGSPITTSGTLALTLSGTALPATSGGTGATTAFTQGSVVFAGVSGVYSQDNAQFFWDNTNFRLGIGTATPGFAIDVLAPSTTVARFRSSGANNSIVEIDNAAGGNQSTFGLYDAGTLKWQIGKQGGGSNNQFFIFDAANNKTPLVVSTTGLLQLGELQQLSLPLAGKVGIGNTAPTYILDVVGGDVGVGTVGNGYRVKEGSNAKQGTATLVAGTVTVANTAVTANSRIFLTIQSLGTVTVPSAICVSARTAGTSFTILSATITDTSVIAYEIFEPY